MNTDRINLENLKLLRQWATPFDDPKSNNFERLCALTIVFIGMYLEQEIAAKMRGR